jgi:hypothetical protein
VSSSRALVACVLTALLVSVGLNLVAPSTLGQRSSGPTQDAASWWPPHPEDQVHLFTESQVAANSDYLVYEVPFDRWLVVVPQAKAVFPMDGSLAAPSMGIESSTALPIFEDLNGDFVELGRCAKYWANAGYESGAPASPGPLGWVLAPGSRLVIRNSNPSQTSYVKVDLFGYLAPVR